MTIDEFNKQEWYGNMRAEYSNKIYDIGSVNFNEALVGLYDGSDDYVWVRCENVDLCSAGIE